MSHSWLYLMSSHASVTKSLASNLALCASHCCVYCLWFNIDRKMVFCEPNTWPPGSSKPGHNTDTDTHALTYTHWQKSVQLDRFNCSDDSSRIGQETARAQIRYDQLRWVWDSGQQHWGRVWVREKEGKTLKKMVIKSYLLNISNKQTLMRIDVSFGVCKWLTVNFWELRFQNGSIE